jgi:hypothetical protein
MMCAKYSLCNSKCMQSVGNERRDFFNYCLFAVNILLSEMEFVLIMECESICECPGGVFSLLKE